MTIALHLIKNISYRNVYWSKTDTNSRIVFSSQKTFVRISLWERVFLNLQTPLLIKRVGSVSATYDSVNIAKTSKYTYLLDTYPEVNWTRGSAILLFMIPVIVIWYGFLLAVILLDPLKNIRCSPSSNLIFNLAPADFLVGVLKDPYQSSFIWLSTILYFLC